MHQHLWPESLVEALAARTSPPLLRDTTLVVDEGSFEIAKDAYGPVACIENLDRDVKLCAGLDNELAGGRLDGEHVAIARRVDVAAHASVVLIERERGGTIGIGFVQRGFVAMDVVTQLGIGAGLELPLVKVQDLQAIHARDVCAAGDEDEVGAARIDLDMDTGQAG